MNSNSIAIIFTEVIIEVNLCPFACAKVILQNSFVLQKDMQKKLFLQMLLNL